jgi:hydroxymethylbilane synthase
LTKTIIIGSRGSDLALWQARFFQGELTKIGVKSEIKIITTKGDKIQHLSFDKIEGKGFFTKEIEQALLGGSIDVAIHSHKDLETVSPTGLTIAAVSYRENPTDLLLVHHGAVDKRLPFGFKKEAVVGTSSARRKSQIKALRPDITIKDIRGNVPTRINKLREGQFDAILLASAGVLRLKLDLSDLYSEELDPRVFIPAPAQGVLAYQCRDSDQELIAILQKLHHPNVKNAISIERDILSGFGGGCHIPIGVYASPGNVEFEVRATFGKDWEKFPKRVRFYAKDTIEASKKFELLKSKEYPKTVFISRSLSQYSMLRKGCEAHGIDLFEQTFIDVKPVSFSLPKEIDWLFFSSSNGVKHFFESVDLAEVRDKKLGVYGEATARTLYGFVEIIDFIASLGQPEDVARQFAQVLKNNYVLFAGARDTLGSVGEGIPTNQKHFLSVYETQLLEPKVDVEFEAYIFTSPSNIKSFVGAGNKIPSAAKVIAIGNSTSLALAEHDISHLTASIPHESELFTLLAS